VKRIKFPKQAYVYLADIDRDGTPIFGVVTDIEELPEDQSGQRIGVYTLDHSPTFVVKRGIE